MAGHHSGTDRSHRGGQPVLGEALRSVTRTVVAAPKITLLLALLVTGSCVAVTACYMRFKTERADLISPAADFHERWIEFTRSFGDADDLVLVVSADEPRVVKRTLQQIGDRLRREPELFADVLYKIEPRALRRKGLQYLTPTQLQRTLRRLEELRPLRQGRPDVAGIGQTTYRVAGELNRATRYAAAGETSPVTPSAQIRQAEALTDSLSRFMSDAGDFRSPWPELLDVDDRLVEDAARVHYFTNDRGTTGFIRVRPAADVATGGFDGHAAAIDRLREIAGETSDPALGVSVGVTGIPVLESDEMRRSQTDMLRAGLYSFAGVGVLLLLGFKGLKHPVLALVMLAIALAWSFGFTTFSVGHLNILSVSFAVILIGLGIDFAIHYTSRYLEYRKEGYDLEEALGEASAGVGTGIVTAAVTTALAFFCATFTQFLGVAELGIIAGGGILLCALATFVILPPLIAIADANTDPEKLPGPGGLSWFNVGAQRFPTVMAALSLGVVLGLGYQAVDWRDELPVSAIGYDYNLLNLQAEGVESVELQKRIAEDGGSLLFAVSVADTPSEARALKRRFEALPTVGRVEELASRLPSHPPQQTRNLVDAIKAEVGRMPRDTPRTGAPNPRVVGKQLETLLTSLRYQRSPEAAAVAEKLDGLLDRFGRLPLQTQARFLSEWQRRSNAALVTQFAALGTATDPTPITAADLPRELTARYVSPDGKWLLQVFPKEEVWDIGPLTRFVEDVRSVDPEITGTPLQNYEASRQIMLSYEKAALYALVIISLVLLVDFLADEHKLLTLGPPLIVVAFTTMTLLTKGIEPNPTYVVLGYLALVISIAAILDFENLRDAVLTLLPPLLGGVMMFGLLAVWGIDLNPANLIVLPLVLGIGVDDGVHVIHDFRMQRRAGKGVYAMSKSTSGAIMLTSLTSMVGFGSLMLAAHRGLYSVGFVLVLGIASCLFVSLVTLPAVLTLITGGPVKRERVGRRKKKRRGGDEDDGMSDEERAEYEELERLEQEERRQSRRERRRAA